MVDAEGLQTYEGTSERQGIDDGRSLVNAGAGRRGIRPRCPGSSAIDDVQQTVVLPATLGLARETEVLEVGVGLAVGHRAEQSR
jgi:hypothetical protein